MARSRTAKKKSAASLKTSSRTTVAKAKPRLTAGYSSADHTSSPPRLEFPRLYNAAADLIDPNLAAGRGKRIAVIDDRGSYTYAALARHVNRCGNALAGLGLGMEQRAMLIMLDTIDFPGVFLGAMKLGAVPVPVNTLLTADDYAFMLRDSRARVLVVSAALFDKVKPALADQPWLEAVVISGGEVPGHKSLARLVAKASDRLDPAATTGDDVAFWLYSSGSTGTPKGAVHVHSSLVTTAELYARPILGLTESDVVFSAAKLFFAYGLGNALTFPFRAGGTAVLMAERPTPQSVCRILKQHRPTVFYGVPTLYASLLASGELPRRGEHALRACVSAGEALPEELGQRWADTVGVDIYDGIGSTEMLHIFLSNGPRALRYGTTGKAVPGYELKLVDETGQPVKPGEVGELLVNGPSSAVVYWNNRLRTRGTFQGEWTRTGDKYLMSEDGFYTYCGRTDDMLKVGGIYVSPFEVEAALVTHPAVLEAAVIGVADDSRLIKPKAYIVLKAGQAAATGLDDELKQHVRDRLAPYKYPRWIEFVADLPKTATGKIQRFKLRQREAERAKPA
ncbi:MAG TPA: benzoate-CoA ligase family protein [Alphaproteobacteria bacterium]|nr:benzoate-CoA ligase family protein [Alphaproteobacteria bacterium]